MSKWQPIETASKVQYQTVIIAGKYPNGLSFSETSYWTGKHWAGRSLDKVTHWMPFPEPPETA